MYMYVLMLSAGMGLANGAACSVPISDMRVMYGRLSSHDHMTDAMWLTTCR